MLGPKLKRPIPKKRTQQERERGQETITTNGLTRDVKLSGGGFSAMPEVIFTACHQRFISPLGRQVALIRGY